MESWWWQARRLMEGDRSAVDLNDRDAFNRMAAGYANRAESLSLFGSYPLREALLLVDGLFGARTVDDQALDRLKDRAPRLHPRARLTSGRYFFQGYIRTTQRILNADSNEYLDLHPGEQVLVAMMDGQHSLAEIDGAAERIRSRDKTQRLPVRAGTELALQLESIGALCS